MKPSEGEFLIIFLPSKKHEFDPVPSMQVIFGLLLYIAMHAASKSCFTFIVAFLKKMS